MPHSWILPRLCLCLTKVRAISMLMFTHRAGSRIIVPEQIQKLTDFKGKSILIPHRFSIQHMLVHRLLSAGKLKLAGLGKSGKKASTLNRYHAP